MQEFLWEGVFLSRLTTLGGKEGSFFSLSLSGKEALVRELIAIMRTQRQQCFVCDATIDMCE